MRDPHQDDSAVRVVDRAGVRPAASPTARDGRRRVRRASGAAPGADEDRAASAVDPHGVGVVAAAGGAAADVPGDEKYIPPMPGEYFDVVLFAADVPILEKHYELRLAGGKRLRPMLTLAAARMCGYDGPYHVHLAATVEFIHTATLIHDDIIDGSDLRRGKPTANTRWGNQTSVLVGDWLYTRTMDLCLELGYYGDGKGVKLNVIGAIARPIGAFDVKNFFR